MGHFHEDHPCGTPRKGFESQGARACIKIEHREILDFFPQNVEERFSNAFCGWTGGLSRRNAQFSPAVSTAYDSHENLRLAAIRWRHRQWLMSE